MKQAVILFISMDMDDSENLRRKDKLATGLAPINDRAG